MMRSTALWGRCTETERVNGRLDNICQWNQIRINPQIITGIVQWCKTGWSGQCTPWWNNVCTYPPLYMEVLLFEFCIVLLPPSPGSTDEPYPKGALYLRVLHCTLYHVLQLIHFQGWHCTLYHCTKGGRWRLEFKWLRNTWFEPHLLPRSIGIIRFYLSLNSNPFERVLDHLLLQS